MNMWAVPPPSTYVVEKTTKPAAKKSKSTDAPKSSKKSSRKSLGKGKSAAKNSDLLNPAVDGPPSPESLRTLSKQMRRSSVLDRHRSHQANSSGSSSLRSLASGDRPSWEHALEGISSLSRKSSGRSTSSSMPSRERPESLQIFGKTLFNRRGKLRREDGSQGSPASSLYSPEIPNEAMPPPTSVPSKDPPTPGIFARRRAAKSEYTDDAAAQTRLQISGPYNFQHVAHTQRNNHQPDMPRSHRATLASELAHVRTPPPPPPPPLRAMHGDDGYFGDFSSEAVALQEEVGSRSRNRPNRGPSLVKKQTSPRRLIKHTKSQEQIRVPPPRPPRSPVEPDYPPAPPVPPPRMSSRVSTRPDGFDRRPSHEIERPLTSGGFRHPRPFAFSPEATSPPATSHGYASRPSLDALPEDYSPRVTTPPADDANWPLPLPTPSNAPYEVPLPGVPEEQESTIHARRSRASVASNASSLRGSQSVPVLRKLSLSQSPESKRPSSGASETLGRFDLFAAQRALKAALMDGSGTESVPRHSWEDDIDYCYDHEVEADCDYAWERPSLDTPRECESVTPVEGDHHNEHRYDGPSPTMLTPGQFDVPALSPASQLSMATAQEAITPTAHATPKASNFSLPISEAPPKQSYLHVQKPSDASSFKESHGFTLSPSLLIPNDYRQQMLASESDERRDSRDASFRISYDGPTLNMGTSPLLAQSRISGTSTNTSDESERSGSERHVSTTSASTDITRLTMSTSSLDMETYIPKCDPADLPPPVEDAEPFHVRAKSQGIMPMLPESMALEQTMSHESDVNLGRVARDGDSRSNAKRKDQLLTRRRARTTSLSTPPPTGQYALFPSVQISGPRI